MSAAEVEAAVGRRYRLRRRLGQGAYGIVWKAIDRQTGEVVAVKKIFDAFRNRTDAQRTFREILFLQEFGNHANVIKLLNVIRAANDKDIYLVFEFMETDLHAVIKKGNLLKDIHIRYILYQLLKATKFIHSGNVIHRDQKPSNILLDADCFVKLCDFGLARCINQIQEDEGNPALTEYVATRWYRAPEILLASPRYTKGVDMWSVGCILGEMLLGKPLFPGTSSINQIERIMSVIPAPSNEDIQSINSDYGASVLHKMLTRPRTTIEQLLPTTTPADALDLLSKLLVFNPYHRLTAQQSLQHPYLSRFHSPGREVSLGYDVVLPVDDDTQLSVAEYRNTLYQMILERKTSSRLQGQLMKTPEPGPERKPEQKREQEPERKPEQKREQEPERKPEQKREQEPEQKPEPERGSERGPEPVRGPVESQVGLEPSGTHWPCPCSPAEAVTRGAAHEDMVPNVSYNPITHSTVTYAAPPNEVFGRKHTQCHSTTYHHWASPVGRASRGQAGHELCTIQQHSKAPESEGGGPGAPRARSLSHPQRAPLPNPPARKDPTQQGMAMGMAVNCAMLNPRPQSQSRDNRPVRKMFQTTSNMEAAGNPKAAWGSYSQTYGVISQSGLDNLRTLHKQHKP